MLECNIHYYYKNTLGQFGHEWMKESSTSYNPTPTLNKSELSVFLSEFAGYVILAVYKSMSITDSNRAVASCKNNLET